MSAILGWILMLNLFLPYAQPLSWQLLEQQIHSHLGYGLNLL